MIAPKYANAIDIQFTSFSLVDTDSVQVFECFDVDCRTSSSIRSGISRYRNLWSWRQGEDRVHLSTGYMRVTFDSNSDGRSYGFAMKWSADISVRASMA